MIGWFVDAILLLGDSGNLLYSKHKNIKHIIKYQLLRCLQPGIVFVFNHKTRTFCYWSVSLESSVARVLIIIMIPKSRSTKYPCPGMCSMFNWKNDCGFSTLAMSSYSDDVQMIWWWFWFSFVLNPINPGKGPWGSRGGLPPAVHHTRKLQAKAGRGRTTWDGAVKWWDKWESERAAYLAKKLKFNLHRFIDSKFKVLRYSDTVIQWYSTNKEEACILCLFVYYQLSIIIFNYILIFLYLNHIYISLQKVISFRIFHVFMSIIFHSPWHIPISPLSCSKTGNDGGC